MSTTTRWATVAAVIMAVLGWTFRAAAAESPDDPRGTASATASATVAANADSPDANAHLRSDSAAIVALMSRANAASATFHDLVERIDASDGTVYVQEGDCAHNPRACFIGVTMAGARRNLWVRVSLKTRDADWNVMGSIAHELRHTLEVLAAPFVTSTGAMELFYRAVGYPVPPSSYETKAAIDAGNAVRDEVQAAARLATIK